MQNAVDTTWQVREMSRECQQPLALVAEPVFNQCQSNNCFDFKWDTMKSTHFRLQITTQPTRELWLAAGIVSEFSLLTAGALGIRRTAIARDSFVLFVIFCIFTQNRVLQIRAWFNGWWSYFNTLRLQLCYVCFTSDGERMQFTMNHVCSTSTRRTRWQWLIAFCQRSRHRNVRMWRHRCCAQVRSLSWKHKHY